MEDSKDLEVTSYEFDGKDYIVAKIVEYENNNYCYLVNIEDPHDVFLKKYVDGELKPVDSKEDAFNILLKIGNSGDN